jgi:hypothetical protein
MAYLDKGCFATVRNLVQLLHAYSWLLPVSASHKVKERSAEHCCSVTVRIILHNPYENGSPQTLQ